MSFKLVRSRIASFDILPELTSGGGLVAAEADSWHKSTIVAASAAYDARTLERIRMGEYCGDEQIHALIALRRRFISGMLQELDGFAALVAPTVPVVAPAMADCLSEPGYSENNDLLLRNPSIANLMDGCSISLPDRDADAPVGLMLTAPAGCDAALFSLAKLVEPLLMG